MQYRKEPIKDFPNYQIDTKGNVFHPEGHKMNLINNSHGYLIVYLFKGEKKYFRQVHRLVALQFLDAPDFPNAQVNHKDGNKHNNCLSNLEWMTQWDNIHHAIENRLYIPGAQSRKPIQGRDKVTGEIKYNFISLAEAGKYFNSNNFRYGQHGIWRALNGMRKSYKGCYWQYKEVQS